MASLLPPLLNSLLVRLVVFFALLWSFGVTGRTPTLSPSLLEKRLQQLRDSSLGVQQMQELYNEAYNSPPSPFNGELAASTLADSVSRRFEDGRKGVEWLHKYAQEALSSQQQTSKIQRCCLLKSSSSASSAYSAMPSFMKVCSRFASGVSNSVPNKVSSMQIMFQINLKRHDRLHLQYVATEAGLTTVFPAVPVLTGCNNYDGRIEPSYVKAVSPKPKDIVILLDTSQSMSKMVNGKKTLDYAKEAVYNVLDSLSQDDEVSVLGFWRDTIAPLGYCQGKGLGRATPSNVELLKDFVGKRLTPTGRLVYGQALKKAFEMFPVRPDSSRDQVILFIAAGEPSESWNSIQEIMDAGNARLNYSAVVMTYTGPDMTASGQYILEQMAKQSYDGVDRHLIKEGSLTRLSSFSKISAVLPRYYKQFATRESTVQTTQPYRGIFSNLTVAFVLPVFVASNQQSVLAGVVGVQILLRSLFADVTYFGDRRRRYAFAINAQGEAVVHPLLGPLLNISEDKRFFNIRRYEQDPGFADVYSLMMMRMPGNVSFLSTEYLSRGNSKFQGVTAVKVMSSYYWEPVPNTEYVVAVVIREEDTQEPTISPQPFASNIVYHRFDLVPPTTNISCLAFGRVALSKQSAVMFAPEAFTDPALYLDSTETASSVHSYLSYLNDRLNRVANTIFKDSIRDEARLTGRIKSVWSAGTASAFDRYVAWRYIGTTSGVFRIRPGVQMPWNYDPRLQSWFQQAIAYQDKLVVSAPFQDSRGAGSLVTVSQAISVGRASQTKGAVKAVMGMDIKVEYLGSLLRSAYSVCQTTVYRCFIIDDSGFLLYHAKFVQPAISRQWVHLIYEEKAIAADLLLRGGMVKRSCASYATQWRTVSFQVVDKMHSGASCSGGYNIYPVEGTNLFVGIVEDVRCDFRCSCSVPGGLAKCIAPTLQSYCECPCYVPLTYETCNNTFPAESQGYDVCPPDSVALASVPFNKTTQSKLKNCSAIACSSIKNNYTCMATVGCNWCAVSSSQKSLSKQYCTSHCDCFRGVQKKSNPNSGGCTKTTTTNTKHSAGFNPAPIGIGIAFFFLFVICRNHKRRQAQRAQQGQSAPRQQSQPAQRQARHSTRSRPNNVELTAIRPRMSNAASCPDESAQSLLPPAPSYPAAAASSGPLYPKAPSTKQKDTERHYPAGPGMTSEAPPSYEVAINMPA